MDRDSSTEESKLVLKEACAVSSVAHRRVIFPSLYSKSCKEESSKKREQEEIVKKSTITGTRQQVLDSLSSSLALQSPGLPPRSSRLCDELGLDVPFISLNDDNTNKPNPPVKKTPVTGTSSQLTMDENYQQLVDALTSPGLPSKGFRLCDELGLDYPSTPLNHDSSRKAKLNLIPKSKAVNSQHFAPSSPPPAATRASTRDRMSLQRRSGNDQRRFAKSPPTSGRLSASCPSSPREPPPSILRHSKHSSSFPTDAVSDKNLPSLVPCGESSTSSNDTLQSFQSSSDHSEYVPRRLTRSVSFDARVWVHQYEQTPEERERSWFSPDELEHFRKQTIARLIAHNTELLTGSGSVVQRGSIPSKAVFAMPAMSAVAEDDDDVEADESEVENAVYAEIQHVLVVDPHDQCAKLFRRDLKRMIPTVHVHTAFSSEEARNQLKEMKRVDIVIVEERLSHFHRHVVDQWSTKKAPGLSSGSAFIEALAKERASRLPEENCLFVAVSAHLDKDKQRMQTSGADFIWAKPPPKMDEIVRDVLLKALLVKREKQALADRLFP